MTVGIRQAIERAIVLKVVDDALAYGYALHINNGGEDDECKPTTDRAKIVGLLFATDEEHLFLTRIEEPDKYRFVYFVYGNDGWDVICDYSDNPTMEKVLKGAHDLANAIEEGKFTIVA